MTSSHSIRMRCALSGAPLISLIRDIFGTAKPHPMTESAWRCRDSSTPTLWHPHSVSHYHAFRTVFFLSA
ncbi:hypothetical protein Syun_007663 [Stephania yunnanensis]|uniref:Uncharacterized protein n=1 Tax=Stephania yunnanensis TaxID=152371 RepID=A0AAP0KYU3_9MAGN